MTYSTQHRFTLHTVALAVLGLLVSTQVGFSQEKTKAVVEIGGIGIAKKDPASEFGGALAVGQAPGTTIDFIVTLKDQQILSLARGKSIVGISTDDGTEMKLTEFFDGIVTQSFGAAKKPERTTLQIRSDDTPPKGTSKLKLKGEVVVVVGRDLKSEEVTFEMEQGEKFKIAGVEVEISGITDAFSDPYKKVIELSAKKPFDHIQSYTIKDSKGNEIPSAEGGSGSFGFNEDVTYSRGINVAAESGKLKVVVKYFAKTEEVKVPVDVEFGLGF